MLFVPSDGVKTFSIQVYRYPEVWCKRHVAAFCETSVLMKEVRILYPLSPQ